MTEMISVSLYQSVLTTRATARDALEKQRVDNIVIYKLILFIIALSSTRGTLFSSAASILMCTSLAPTALSSRGSRTETHRRTRDHKIMVEKHFSLGDFVKFPQCFRETTVLYHQFITLTSTTREPRTKGATAPARKREVYLSYSLKLLTFRSRHCIMVLMGRPATNLTLRSHIDTLLKKQRRLGFSVYYLLGGQEVIYVGSTADPTRRLAEHKSRVEGVQLKVQVVVETQEEAERLEKELIALQRRRGSQLLNAQGDHGGNSPQGGQLSHPAWMGAQQEKLLKPQSVAERKARRLATRAAIQGTQRTADEMEK